jgi:plasmid maintenance system antidote protein VapI
VHWLSVREDDGYLRVEFRQVYKAYVSAEMAMKFSKALGASPQFRLGLQNNWELSQVDAAVYKKIGHVVA